MSPAALMCAAASLYGPLNDLQWPVVGHGPQPCEDIKSGKERCVAGKNHKDRNTLAHGGLTAPRRIHKDERRVMLGQLRVERVASQVDDIVLFIRPRLRKK
jgi:hypothetical protein